MIIICFFIIKLNIIKLNNIKSSSNDGNINLSFMENNDFTSVQVKCNISYILEKISGYV